MTHKQKIRDFLGNTIEQIEKQEDLQLRFNGLLGIADVIDETLEDLKLDLGGLRALIEINKIVGDK